MNGWVLLMGLGYGLVETAYFGWNMTAKSDAEMVCDGIAILITALGMLRLGAPR